MNIGTEIYTRLMRFVSPIRTSYVPGVEQPRAIDYRRGSRLSHTF